MPQIRISRGGGYADALRSYEIVIDGKTCGSIKRHEVQSFDLPAGPHDLQLFISGYTSPKITFDLCESGASFACRPNSHPLMATVNLFLKRHNWIALERTDVV